MLVPKQSRVLSMKKFTACIFAITCFCCNAAFGWYPSHPDESLLPQTGYSTVIGSHQIYAVRPGDTLIELARQGGLGYLALTKANPDIDPWLPPVGASILFPYAFLLPAGIQQGITVNLAELRLYYVWQELGRLRVRVYPVGIGRSGWGTPEGSFKVIEKIVHPAWHPPASIRLENPQLPTSIPPGPDNPLGEYWLGISAPGYGIHGTNKPYGVGRRISHGCMRLYPWDIRDLFARVKIGTAVRILRQPVKAGIIDGKLLIEVHRPVDANDQDVMSEALQQIASLRWKNQLDMETLEKEIHLGKGVPTVISLE
jgi:L,D-transpeptidase ErfK/SrfK